MFLKLCSLFTIFARKKPPSNHHKSLKKMYRQENLFRCLKHILRFLKKLLVKIFFFIFVNILKVMFSLYCVLALKDN